MLLLTAKKGTNDAHLMGSNFTADKGRAAAKACLENRRGAPCYFASEIFFLNYYLLNHIPDEQAESSPCWQVKKT